MKLLRKIADQGRTICATIHQPSSAVFDMFVSVPAEFAVDVSVLTSFRFKERSIAPEEGGTCGIFWKDRRTK